MEVIKMDTIEQIVVSLDPVSGQDILVKKTPVSYMEKRVRDLLEYMLNPNKDDSNPGYNQSEREVAAMINRWVEEAKADESKPEQEMRKKFVVAAKPVNGGDPIPLNLSDKLYTYRDRIVQNRSLPGGNSSELFPSIDLYASLGRISGIIKPYHLIQRQHQT